MKYQIVELDEFTGSMATVYSVLPEGTDLTLFDTFVEENYEKFKDEVQDIISTLEVIGKQTGAREKFFKLDEGKPGDGICAMFDEPERNLRLYCIRWGSVAILVGGGGYKPKNIRAWQEDANLSHQVKTLMQIASDIQQRIDDKEITFTPDGYELQGNINFTNDEQQ